MALVCLGSCVFTIDSMWAFIDGPMAWDASRVAAAIPSGVGFLGAATIWKGTASKQDGGEPTAPEVHGLTTATSVWLSAAIGILCGGGPAPGMNSVICAATIEAINSGWEVYGIPDGFSRLMEGDTSKVHRLTVEDVSRIHLQGGSVLFTSRANPTKDPVKLAATVAALAELQLDALMTIGGDDTGHSAAVVALTLTVSVGAILALMVACEKTP